MEDHGSKMVVNTCSDQSQNIKNHCLTFWEGTFVHSSYFSPDERIVRIFNREKIFLQKGIAYLRYALVK